MRANNCFAHFVEVRFFCAPERNRENRRKSGELAKRSCANPRGESNQKPKSLGVEGVRARVGALPDRYRFRPN